MRILFLGDVVGRPGRRAVLNAVPRFVNNGVDFVVANCENAAGGRGVDPGAARELLAAGIDVLTSGNHVWAKRELIPYIGESEVLLRPANFPSANPGSGHTVRSSRGGARVAVINLMGRVFMGSSNCPFLAAEDALVAIGSRASVVIVDIHGEATSEKMAMGWFLNGRVSAVIGTHTHVQTADERILPGGTAYLTDAGMCGPRDSVIGVKKELVIERFLTQMPNKFDVASGPAVVQGAVIDVDESTGRAIGIERIQHVFEG